MKIVLKSSLGGEFYYSEDHKIDQIFLDDSILITKTPEGDYIMLQRINGRDEKHIFRTTRRE